MPMACIIYIYNFIEIPSVIAIIEMSKTKNDDYLLQYFCQYPPSKKKTMNDENKYMKRFEMCSLDRNSELKFSLSLLHCVVQKDCEKEIIEDLISQGEDVNSKDPSLLTPLHYAIQCKRKKKKLLKS